MTMNLGKQSGKAVKSIIFPLAVAIVLAVLVGAASAPQNSSQHKVFFEKAKFTMETKGDLKGAIGLFEEIIKKYPGERDYAAKSQLYIGMCYEKLGFAQAQAAFQKVLDNYPEQTEAVFLAREKLMTLTRLYAQTLENDGRFQMRRIGEASSSWTGCSISSHGKFLAFADRMNSSGEVAAYDLSSGKVRCLTDDANETEGAWECVVSPDGRRIAYGWLNNDDDTEGLRLVAMDGSEPRILYSDTKGVPMAPVDWSPDGKDIVVYHQGIGLVSVDDGSIRVLKRSDPKLRYLNGRIRISPDGRYIAYDWPPESSDGNRNIFILSVDGSYDAPLIERSSNDTLLDWCPDGKSLLFRSDRTGSSDAWRIWVKDGRADGPAELVKKDLGLIQPLGFTQGGSFYFMNSTGGWDICTAKIDLNASGVIEGPENPLEEGVGRNVSAAWSPDGKFLAYITSGPGRDPVIRVRSEETGREREISPQPGFYGVEWFPDGSSLKVYGEDKEGDRGLCRVDTRDGAVETLLKQTPEAPLHRACLGPEGKTIVYSSYQESEDLSSIIAYEIHSKRKREIWRGKGKVGLPKSSPDGQWLALEIPQGNGSERKLAVMPATGGEMRELAVSNSGGDFVWAPDSQQILFAKLIPGSGYGNSRQGLWVVRLDGGPPRSLNLESRLMWLLTIHPEGDQIAYSTHKSGAEIWVMENFLAGKPTRGR
ncbi:MAG: PD40 domain-containing protein [Candidatus Aminicenantes bacterium]|nr:PD40 domain-containing protein [Candidatus Aminicenantes bacterium]